MKIAHCMRYAPRRAGMYETVRDLAEAECALGHEAMIVDTNFMEDGSSPPKSFKFDRGVDIATIEWAMDADVHILHSRIPPQIYGKKPIVMLLHGAPEYLFYSQVFRHKEGDAAHSTVIQYSNDENVVLFVTMWERHVAYWQAIMGDERVRLIPPIVNPGNFSPVGEKEELKKAAAFNVGFCDTWRPTFYKEPFQILPGVREFWKRQNDIKIHIFGIPSEGKRAKIYGNAWDKHILALQRNGDYIGDIWELHPSMEKVYRALDVVVTMTVDENRIVRETLASGVPLIGPEGNRYATYPCQIDHPMKLADTLVQVRKDLEENPEAVQKNSLDSLARMQVGESAKKFVEFLEEVV